jgi:uncharacterized protein (TIGR00290 family)
MHHALFNWSGGKDSALALFKVKRQNMFNVRYLLTSVNEQNARVSMHGVRAALLQQQAQYIGISLHQLLLPEMPSMEIYEQYMLNTLQQFGKEGMKHSIFGDIFLEDLRTYRESLSAKANFQAVFPLWKLSTKDLMQEFLSLGFQAIVVCVNTQYLDKSFAGRMIDTDFIKDLPAGVDLCGENGEYHSFVFNGPIFSKPVSFTIGETIYRTYISPSTSSENMDGHSSNSSSSSTGFWFTDLIPELNS